MPSPASILDTATTIANQWRSLAIGWHVAAGAFVVALLAGWRPSNRTAGWLLATPIVSVAAVAAASRNPFNTTTFLILGFVLMALARRLSGNPVQFGSPLSVGAGSLLLAFGWGYPHFLVTDHWTEYAYAAPFGLLPCPTLSAAIGVTLMLDLLRSTSWSASLAAAGVVYGAIGVFSLDVALDYGLLAGAIALLGVVARQWGSSMPRPDHPMASSVPLGRG